MAIDQAILESTVASGRTTLRFYGWSPATLSLGYFQKVADRQSHSPSESCPIVRRASGGGAIVHDDELTYSLCVATKGSIAKANAGLYDLVHNAILAALSEQGIAAELYEAAPDQEVKASKADPFLCFERRAVGDIILDGAKVGGSAQRRLKNALIQHGSLLLSRSRFAPELPGLKELSGKPIDESRLIESISAKVADAMQVKFVIGELSTDELNRAAEVESERFGSESWLNKK
ncbi:Octanoyltransferase LipM [Mariniblastus fucicola]|uniref:Octanoyltransferase LipM n=2 Tax=Mariniblastus fucicola TaxID=980251 RepID=A0A5B9PCR0_9BACT|nr:Octanoyltransferase LipM [Mariniblastus fucicola]